MAMVTSFSMFFVSFVPLWLAVLFIDIKNILQNQNNIYTEIISVFVIVFGLIFSFIVINQIFNSKSKGGTKNYEIVSAKEEKYLTSEFLLAYILPLFAFDFTLWYEVILFIIFFSTFAFLSIRHSNFSVNIILEIAKYRFYFCELKNEDERVIKKTIICKDILSSQIGRNIATKPINNQFMIISKK